MTHREIAEGLATLHRETMEDSATEHGDFVEDPSRPHREFIDAYISHRGFADTLSPHLTPPVFLFEIHEHPPMKADED